MLNLLKYNFNKKFWSGVPKTIHSIKKKILSTKNNSFNKIKSQSSIAAIIN